jgi:hypothetical protein
VVRASPDAEHGGSAPTRIDPHQPARMRPKNTSINSARAHLGTKNDLLKDVVVKIGSKKVADVKGVKKIKKGITLKKLPTGTYKISVVATTILKQRLTGCSIRLLV